MTYRHVRLSSVATSTSPGGRGLKEVGYEAHAEYNAATSTSPGGRGLKALQTLQSVKAGFQATSTSPGGRGLKVRVSVARSVNRASHIDFPRR